jgi:predicted alpha/beta superfamily hydrolase
MPDMRQTLRLAFERIIRRDGRQATARAGRLVVIPEFESRILGNRRHVTVFLPAGYDEQRDRRYPVLYMQDGQNLFEPGRAFIPGQHWRLHEAADAALSARTARPTIVVGIDNAGSARIDEYTPTRDDERIEGGRGREYGRMLVEELKPLVDGSYRTMTDSANTAVGGSSLGGLIALHLALTRSDVFGSAAVMSPSVWWNGRAILGEVDDFKAVRRPRIWLDVGGREGREALDDVRALRSRLLANGWNKSNLRFYQDRRGDHSERAWAGRMRRVMEFLFPPESFFSP